MSRRDKRLPPPSKHRSAAVGNATRVQGGPSASEAATREVDELRRQVEDLRRELAEREEMAQTEQRTLLLRVLDGLDAFERVLKHAGARADPNLPQLKTWLGNFQTVFTMFGLALSRHGVSAIENLDQGFDPHWHSVHQTVIDSRRPEGTIVEETKRGYVWKGQILRKSEVVVQGAESPESVEVAACSNDATVGKIPLS